MEALEVHTVFTIPIGDGIPVYESVVVTWIIMAVFTLLSIILVRNLRVENVSKKQLMLESFIEFLQNFFEGTVGKNGKRYVPYLITVALYIGASNLIGVFGFTPPTKDMNVTAALAIASIILIEYSGIHQKGVKGWLKAFGQPVPVIAPLNLLEIIIRPLSLCMRLFGNVLGSFVVMELLKALLPVGLPVPFSLYFDVFDGLIQAYVFVFLTSLFIKEAVE
ncbi:MAG TPA: F0F1 ATP synthase subunit A [Candidatus Scybalocola faecigallinarum]|uniref:ATP synthase subunit a n=1 Tax=Candidatus Scybalocola faecigallinarum TaxID=2840941 RepID=A0A9D1JRF1_9FIRM|nr:F0F1 ATP synthase subunit A [Candidatus Scybalocola faecigallinarum]